MSRTAVRHHRRDRGRVPAIDWRLAIGVWLIAAVALGAEPAAMLDGRIGPRDAVWLAAPDGRIVYRRHADTSLVPASTLKILTVLAALDTLGPDHRFATDLYRTPDNDLVVKGYGDPLLVSEVLQAMAQELAARWPDTKRTIRHVVVDDTHFAAPIRIPGVARSTNPYDAPNGALCTNFNTVAFARDATGRPVSAEPQTPLLPRALPIVRGSGLRQGRIVLPAADHTPALYAGDLIAHCLGVAGMTVTGRVRRGVVEPARDRLVWRHRSPWDLRGVAARLLEYSNNFMANQLLLAMGVERFGAPGDLSKGVRTLHEFSATQLGIADATLVEGSGISRANRLSAAALGRVLLAFTPHHRLLHHGPGRWVKTGHLAGVRTLAGYIEGPRGGLFPFVILRNTPGAATAPLLEPLHALIARTDE